MSMRMSTYDSSLDFGSQPDRRRTSRFPVLEEVRYRLLLGKRVATRGVGRTVNIGSGGILFTTEETLPMGRRVEVAVNWPVRLSGACRLQLVAVGVVELHRAFQLFIHANFTPR